MATMKALTVEQAMSATESEDGFRCVRLADTSFTDLDALKREVGKAVEAGKVIKSLSHLAAPEKKEALEAAGISAYAERNVLFEYCNENAVQEKMFEAFEIEGDSSVSVEDDGKVQLDVIWSTQVRSVPADLIVRPKPNPWTDGAAKDPHVDSHFERVLTEYVVDAARLEDCWTHSAGFRALAGKWMSTFFAEHEQDNKAECLAKLTQDMRRLRYHHTFVEKDSRVAPLAAEEVSDTDKEPSTFWSAFELLPIDAGSFWCNLTTEADERVAKPLAFAHPSKVTHVPDRSLTKRPMPPRVGAKSVMWASHTLSGPEYAVTPGAEYKCVLKQPFGFLVAFDTRVAPHVAHTEDDREGATRVSLEARRLRFAVDTSKWVVVVVKPAVGAEEVLVAEAPEGTVVIKDCPLTVVPGFIACVCLDEDPVASRAKMFKVAQAYFSSENRRRFGLTEDMELFSPRTPYKAGTREHQLEIGAHLTLACAVGSYPEEVTQETVTKAAGQRMDVSVDLSSIKLVQPAKDENDEAVRGPVYVTALVDRSTADMACRKRKQLGYGEKNPSPYFHVSLAVISYKNEDHKAMRNQYQVDTTAEGHTRLAERKTAGCSTPQSSGYER